MDKEELMKYAKDPFWIRLRWFLFITFWVCWAAMLVGAIMIIYEAPKCEPPAPRTWLVNRIVLFSFITDNKSYLYYKVKYF